MGFREDAIAAAELAAAKREQARRNPQPRTPSLEEWQAGLMEEAIKVAATKAIEAAKRRLGEIGINAADVELKFERFHQQKPSTGGWNRALVEADPASTLLTFEHEGHEFGCSVRYVYIRRPNAQLTPVDVAENLEIDSYYVYIYIETEGGRIDLKANSMAEIGVALLREERWLKKKQGQ